MAKRPSNLHHSRQQSLNRTDLHFSHRYQACPDHLLSLLLLFQTFFSYYAVYGPLCHFTLSFGVLFAGKLFPLHSAWMCVHRIITLGI